MRQFCAALFLCCLAIPVALNSDCGPGYQPFYGYTFINPEITHFDAELAPFFLNLTDIHKEYFKSQETIYQTDNAKEWQERYCENGKLEDIEYVLYTASSFQLEDLRRAMSTEGARLSQFTGTLATNSWARYMFKHDCLETVDYLIFAKKCEPYVTAPAESWRKPRRDPQTMQRLIEEAHQRFLFLESHYIKLRYAFQAIRLAQYMGDYEQTLELVDYYLPKIDNDPSLVDYWIMGLQAGALRATGQNAEAAYLYSRVFEKCPDKRQSAYRSFRINTNEEWEEALLMCKNDHERAGMYVLRAASPHARLIKEMRSIYDYDPEHHALEMLLIREVQRLEKDLLARSINPQRNINESLHNIPRAYAGERIIELQALVREWLDEGRLPQPGLWQLALGYMQVIAGNYYEARQTLTEAEEMIEDETLLEQIAVFRLVLRILSLRQIDGQEERRLTALEDEYEFYTDYPDFGKLINDKLLLVYRAQGDEAKAYLMEYTLAQLHANPDIEIIDELIFLCRKKDRTRFEDAIVQRSPDGETIINDLLNTRATYLIAQGAVESALSTLKEIPKEDWDNYGQFNPFVRRFKDCVHCFLPDSVTTFNRVELLQRLIDMEFAARAELEPDLAAGLYFDLGEAYYNMTYFGQAWHVTDHLRSGTSANRAYRNKGQEVFSYPGLPLGNKENFNCDRAKAYFDLARRTARSDEIKVAAAYMGAKCERNDFYVNGTRRTFDYFDIIEREYPHTQFYQRIIAECRDYQSYLLK